MKKEEERPDIMLPRYTNIITICPECKRKIKESLYTPTTFLENYIRCTDCDIELGVYTHNDKYT